MKDWLISLAQAVGLFALLLWAVAAMVHGAHGQLKNCSVSELYAIAWSVHNPSERHHQMLQWLNSRGPWCTADDLGVIWNNLGEWAGTSDSAEMRTKVLELYGKVPKK